LHKTFYAKCETFSPQLLSNKRATTNTWRHFLHINHTHSICNRNDADVTKCGSLHTRANE